MNPADLARLKLTYAPHWLITASIPGLGPRTLTAVELGTGRHIRARNEPEMDAKLQQASEPASNPQPPARTECAHL